MAVDIDQLNREHDSLTTKRFADGLTRKETARLAYVRWQIDTYEDAVAGEGEELDRLELLVETHERISGAISDLRDRLRPLR